MTRAVFGVFSGLLAGSAPAGYNASVDAIARRRLTSKLLLGAPLALDPTSNPGWPWLSSAIETSLTGCADAPSGRAASWTSEAFPGCEVLVS